MVFTQHTAATEPQTADEHDLVSTGVNLEQTISASFAPGTEGRNVATVFDCTEHFGAAPPVLSYAFGVYDGTGALADCLAGGHDAASLATGAFARTAEPSFVVVNCILGVPAR